MLRVLFLQDTGLNESLAATEASATLQQEGVETRLLLSKEEKRLERKICLYNPQLAIIPCPVMGVDQALQHADLVARLVPDCIVLLAGTQATLEPSLCTQPKVDGVVLGEAELPLKGLLLRLRENEDWRQTPGIASARYGHVESQPLSSQLTDLDSLPMPDRDLYFRYRFLARFPWKKFSTGRGCPHSCSFCWNPEIRKNFGSSAGFVRRKSPERAVEEVSWVKSRYPLRRVHFSDDLFTMDSDWLEKFSAVYSSRVRLPFTCNSTATALNPRVVDALKEAGCHGVAMGLETGNERIRTQVLNKRVGDGSIRTAARLLKQAKIELTTFNMVGSPTERPKDVYRTIAMNREIRADHIRVTRVLPMPHSKLVQRLAQERADGESSSIRQEAEMDRLVPLFRLAVRHAWLEPILRQVATLPCGPLLRPLAYLGALEEKRINGLRLIEGLRYFRHTGLPSSRTANYVTLV